MSQGKQNLNETGSPAGRLRDYVYANLFFWGFLLALAFVSFFTCGAVWDEVFQGILEFLFVILGGGFTLVSVLDYLYDKYLGQAAPEEKK